MTNKDQFIQKFQNEHRIIRDTLINMIAALGNKDLEQSKDLLLTLNTSAGPHFRYEEEALYPALVDVFGPAYIAKLYTDHDIVIARTKRLRTMLEQHSKPVDYALAIKDVQALLPYVSDCEGLAVLLERFDDLKVSKIASVQQKSWKRNLDLFTWSETVRGRKPLQFIHS